MRLLCPWASPVKNTGVGCHFLLQGIFTTPISCIGGWILYHWATFSSVAQSCPTPWDPMDGSASGLLVHHQLPEFTQTHVHWFSDAIQPSHPLSSLFLLPSIFLISRSFPMSQFFQSGGQSIVASASASVFPMIRTATLVTTTLCFMDSWEGLGVVGKKPPERKFKIMQILPICGSVTEWSEWEACNSCWPMQRLCKRTEIGLVNLQCKQSTFGAMRKKEKDRKTDERILGKVNLPGWRKAEKKEQRDTVWLMWNSQSP